MVRHFQDGSFLIPGINTSMTFGNGGCNTGSFQMKYGVISDRKSLYIYLLLDEPEEST